MNGHCRYVLRGWGMACFDKKHMESGVLCTYCWVIWARAFCACIHVYVS